jgi:hypothetical protein
VQRWILTILVVGAGTAPPARTVIEFGTAAMGPRSAFSSVHHFGITIAARARRVAALRLGGRDHVLLVAPTREGGFCTSLFGPYGGTSCPLTAVVRGEVGVLAPDMVGDASGPILFDGYFTFPSAARLQVTYQDGERGTIPFVWVTSPIRAGFFLYDLTRHRRAGHRPAFVTLLDGHRRQLAERQLPP